MTSNSRIVIGFFAACMALSSYAFNDDSNTDGDYFDQSPQTASKTYYGKALCAYPDFTCVQVRSGDTWVRLFPNPVEREIVKRLNRTNMALRYRSWIVVPKNLKTINHLDLSPLPVKLASSNRRTLLVNLGVQAFGAYDKNGDLVHWGPISGGRDWCEDVGRPCRTLTGRFSIIRKQGAECESSKFPIETNGGAPMPYCMHYYRGYALHGSTLPGFHASHGCVRLFLDDAKWLNEEFAKIGTKVIVTRY